MPTPHQLTHPEQGHKRTVDRSIGEFERRQDQVARDNRDQQVARTYLTSETGTVSIMPAHDACVPGRAIP